MGGRRRHSSLSSCAFSPSPPSLRLSYMIGVDCVEKNWGGLVKASIFIIRELKQRRF